MNYFHEETAEKLKQREAELAEAQRLAHLGSWSWDIQTNTITWSDELYRIFGLLPQEFPATFEGFLACIHPDDRERTRATVQEALKTCQPYVDTRRVVRPDGEIRIVEARGSVVCDVTGTPLKMFGASQDITERTRTEKALHEAQQKYRDILDNLQEGVFQTTPEGKFVTANRALVRMLGFSSEEELIAMRANIACQHYVNPTDRDEFKRQLTENGNVRGFEFEAYRKDGSRIWLSENGRAVRDSEEKVAYYEGTAEDITQRKRTEAMLANLRRELELTMESMQEGVHRVDQEGHIAFNNRAAAGMLGWDAADLIGRPAHATMHHKRADGSPYPKEACPIHATLSDGVPREITDEVFWRKDGTSFPVEYTTAPMRDEGEQLIAAVVTFRDITDRKRSEAALRESEERYRELFENSRDAIYVHDLNGHYTSVNHAAEDLSGYTRDEINGKHYSNFVLPTQLTMVHENLCRKLDVPLETTYETEILCKNGTRKPVEVSSRIIYRNGEPVGVQGTVRDITERKRAQRALQDYSRRLVSAQEAERENIARQLHDEIGQALTAISINLEWILRSGAVNESAVPRLGESIAVIDDALRSVRELSFELRPSLLDDLGLAAALTCYAARFSERTGIHTDVIGNLPKSNGIGSAVETACFRIAQEALTNTARYSQATNAAIYLEHASVGFLKLTISDNGIGFLVDSYLGEGRTMTALGLRGMYERAQAVNGRVEINSFPGRGTQVVLEVPIGIPPFN